MIETDRHERPEDGRRAQRRRFESDEGHEYNSRR